MMPYVNYIKAGLLALLVCGIFYSGWHIGHNDYVVFKAQTEAIAQKQIAENKAKAEEQEIINRSKDAEYQANVSNIRNFYNRMLDNPSSSTVSIIPNPTSLTDAKAQYIVLASSCATTTEQLISLQDWINQQIALK